MVKMFMRAVAVLALAFAGTAVAAQPAQAAWSQCPSGYFCIWTGAGGTGNFTHYSSSYVANIPGDGCHSWATGTFDNSTDSWWNRTSYTIRMHDGGSCWGTSTFNRLLSPGQQATSTGSDWGNRFSSFNRVV